MQAWPKEDFLNEDKRSTRVTNMVYCFFFCKLLACYNPSGYFGEKFNAYMTSLHNLVTVENFVVMKVRDIRNLSHYLFI
jgi:hypothetical protein